MIKQFVNNKTCLKCRGCCRFHEKLSKWSPSLLKEEIGAVYLETKIPLVPEQGGLFLCAFFDAGKNKCGIYNRRPFECRLYPFVINKGAGKIFLAIDLNCGFAETHVKTPAFKKFVEYLSSASCDRVFCKIIKNNPQIIQTYENVFDVLELNR